MANILLAKASHMAEPRQNRVCGGEGDRGIQGGQEFVNIFAFSTFAIKIIQRVTLSN